MAIINPRLCPKSYRPVPINPASPPPAIAQTANLNFGLIERAIDDLRLCNAEKLTKFGQGGPPTTNITIPVNLSTGDWVKTVTYGTFGAGSAVGFVARGPDFPSPGGEGAPVTWLTDGDGRDEASSRGSAGPYYPIEWQIQRTFKKVRLMVNVISVNTTPVTANIVFALSVNGAYNPNSPGVFLPASLSVNDASPGNYDTGLVDFTVNPFDTVGIVMHGSVGAGPLAYGGGQIQCTATLYLIADEISGGLVVHTVGVPGPA